MIFDIDGPRKIVNVLTIRHGVVNMNEAMHRGIRQTLAWKLGVIVLLLAGPALLLKQPLRFTVDACNHVLGWPLAFLLPLIANIKLFRLNRTWATVLAIPVAIYSLLLFLGFLMFGYSAVLGNNTAFKAVAQVEWNHSTVKLYRIHASGLDGIDLSIRQELNIIPGVILTRSIHTFRNCNSATMTLQVEGIRVEPAACRDPGDAPTLLRLRHFVYF